MGATTNTVMGTIPMTTTTTHMMDTGQGSGMVTTRLSTISTGATTPTGGMIRTVGTMTTTRTTNTGRDTAMGTGRIKRASWMGTRKGTRMRGMTYSVTIPTCITGMTRKTGMKIITGFRMTGMTETGIRDLNTSMTYITMTTCRICGPCAKLTMTMTMTLNDITSSTLHCGNDTN